MAFSASYQLVARFANKNVIALGLGCSASGPVVLVLQVALGMGPQPTHTEEVWLYQIITATTVAGLWAAVSLLVRHWDAVEASTLQGEPEQYTEQQQLIHGEEALRLSEPLLPPRSAEGSAIPVARPAPSPRLSVSGSSPIRQLLKHPSLPPLVHYASLEPFASPLGLTGAGEAALGAGGSAVAGGDMGRLPTPHTTPHPSIPASWAAAPTHEAHAAAEPMPIRQLQRLVHELSAAELFGHPCCCCRGW